MSEINVCEIWLMDICNKWKKCVRKKRGDGVLCHQNWLFGSIRKISITASFDEQCPLYQNHRNILFMFLYPIKEHRAWAFFCLNSQFGCDMSHVEKFHFTNFQSYHSHFDELSWKSLLIKGKYLLQLSEWFINTRASVKIENTHYCIVNTGCDVLNSGFPYHSHFDEFSGGSKTSKDKEKNWGNL